MTNRDFEFTDGTYLAVGTMYCIGRNYAAHAKEMNAEVPPDPLVFLKAPSAYVGSGSAITLPSFSKNVHHEVELVVVVGSYVENASPTEVMSCVAGYAVGIDLTLRDIQATAKQKGEPWTLSKAFKGSAPISKVVPAQNVQDLMDLEITLDVNGQRRQTGKIAHMERSVAELLSYLSYVFSLRRGDCLFTGTPEGVSQIVTGDKIHASLNNYTSLDILVL